MTKPAADYHPHSSSHASSSACLVASLVLALVSGCSTQSGVSMRKNGAEPVPLTADSAWLPTSGLSFSLSPLDKLRVQIVSLAANDGKLVFESYDTVKYEFSLQGQTYRVLRGDELTIHFGADPKNDLVVIVRPDGKIGLSNVAEIAAAGRTPAELAVDIDSAYRERLNKPASSVSVSKSNVSVAELSGESVVQPDGMITVPKLGNLFATGLSPTKLAEKLSAVASDYFGNAVVAQTTRIPASATSGGLIGFDKSLVISPEGQLALPEIGLVSTKGKTVSSLQVEIQDAVHVRYQNPLLVTVAIEASEARVVYVDGEVSRPGAYPLTPTMTLLKAVTVAGGSTDTGNLREIILIHRDPENNVLVYITNLKEFIQKGEKGQDLLLSPQDIVVVPKTSVAKANLWIDQYITRMLPFSRSASYSYNQGQTRLN